MERQKLKEYLRIVVDMEKCIEYADEHNLIFTAVSKDEI